MLVEKSKPYLSNLTPLRGIAAILVTLFHFQVLTGRFIPDSTTFFISHSYLFVDLFFVMSGFIIKHVYEELFSEGISSRNYWDYLGARFSRIYPLHLFTLLILVILFYTAMKGHGNIVMNPNAIPTNIFLLQSFNIHKCFTWNVPSWSISAEWFSYLLFPFLVFIEQKSKKLYTIFSILFILGAYLGMMYFFPRVDPFMPGKPVLHNLDVTFDYGFLRGLAGFMTGMLVYQWYQIPGTKNWAKHDLASFAVIILLCIGLHFKTPDVLIIPIFAILVLCITSNDGLISKISNFKFPQYIGKISYSIYLVQIFIGVLLGGLLQALHISMPKGMNVTLPFGKGLLIYLLFLVILVIISTLTYYGIEKPCRLGLNKLFKHKERSVQSIA